MRTIAGTAAALAAVVLGLGWSPAGASGQNADAEAAMVAAGQWVRGQLPGGVLRLDGHRTGRSTDGRVTERIASALGAEVSTLERTRTCTDVMDPSTCRLASSALIAIEAARVRGDEATVRVYAWFRQEDPRNPVGKGSWDVRLRRTGDGWTVSGEARLD